MGKNAVDCNRYRNEGGGGEWINDTGHGGGNEIQTWRIVM